MFKFSSIKFIAIMAFVLCMVPSMFVCTEGCRQFSRHRPYLVNYEEHEHLSFKDDLVDWYCDQVGICGNKSQVQRLRCAYVIYTKLDYEHIDYIHDQVLVKLISRTCF
jgi:hypothetical protein